MLLAAAALSARITRLVTRDTITMPLRKYAYKLHEFLGVFVECRWCIGWWICVIVHGIVYTAWSGGTASTLGIIVWLASASAVNLAYGLAGSVCDRVADMADTVELTALAVAKKLKAYTESS